MRGWRRTRASRSWCHSAWFDKRGCDRCCGGNRCVDRFPRERKYTLRVCIDERNGKIGKERTRKRWKKKKKKKKKKKRSDGGEEETQVGRGRKSVAREREQERERSRFKSVQASPSKVKSLSFSLPPVDPSLSFANEREKDSPRSPPCPLLFTRKYTRARGRVLVQKERQTDRQIHVTRSRSREESTIGAVACACVSVCVSLVRVFSSRMFLYSLRSRKRRMYIIEESNSKLIEKSRHHWLRVLVSRHTVGSVLQDLTLD